MLKQIFELFAQTDRPLDRSQGGLGIGLRVVRSLAQLHGGTAEAFSNGDGQGTEIVIRLPLLPETRLPTHSLQPLHAGAAEQARRVLLVEDNRDAAEVLATYLRSLGHSVHLAYDGSSGMKVAFAIDPTS